MSFFILILCLNTITSMINTNVFFDLTDFQVVEDDVARVEVHPLLFQGGRNSGNSGNSGNSRNSGNSDSSSSGSSSGNRGSSSVLVVGDVGDALEEGDTRTTFTYQVRLATQPTTTVAIHSHSPTGPPLVSRFVFWFFWFVLPYL
jgi:hypothetical protein